MTNSEEISDSLLDVLDDEMLDLIDGKTTLQKETNNTISTTTDKQVHSPELIIFYGPPCCGKTEYYNQEFSSKTEYVRICPPEIYSKEKDFSFHRLINLVTDHLSKDINVIIDDENHLLRTRKSYFKAVKEQQDKKKLGDISFIAICFQPLGGMKQCLWANEWAIAQYMTEIDDNDNNSTFKPKSIERFESWFHSENNFPTKNEGFSDIRIVHSKLHCNDTENLDKKALFIDVASTFTFEKFGENVNDRKITLIKGDKTTNYVHEKTLQQFSQKFKDAVIIFLMDETSFYPMSIEVEESFEKQQELITNWRNQFKGFLENWSTLLQVPIYYTIAEYGGLEPDSFFQLPNCGMLAYSQFIHELDLASSIYVSGDDISSSLGKSIGFSCVLSAKNFFSNSGWDITSKLRKFGNNFSQHYPDFLQVVEFSQTYRSHSYSYKKEFHSGIGRLHGHSESIVTLDDFGVDIEPTVPSQFTGVSQSLNTSQEFLSSPSPQTASAPQHKLPNLSEAYIRSLVTPATFERGMQYFVHDTIFNRRQKGFTITGMCKGSSSPPYSLTAELSQKKPKAIYCKCSCPIGTGKCKHVVAFLLCWVHNSDKFKVQPVVDCGSPIPASPIPPTPKKLNQNDELATPKKAVLPEDKLEKEKEKESEKVSEFMSSHPGGKRKLPNWMREESPTKKVKISSNIKRDLFSDKINNTAEDKEVVAESNVDIVVETLSPKELENQIDNETNEPKSTPVVLRSVKDVLADLDKELESEISDITLDDFDEIDEIEEAYYKEKDDSSTKPKVSLKEKLNNLKVLEE